MAPTAHSQFPASSSSRLLHCPGSYTLQQAYATGERTSTVYSAEGTLAHSLSEACLFAGVKPESFIGQTRSADGFEFKIDHVFIEAVEVYVNFMKGLRAMGYIIVLETRVSPQVHWDGLADLGISLFGTSDCIAYHPALKRLVIGDLKFGAGVPVDAKGNSQLRYYGAGSAHEDVIRPICAQAGVEYNGIDDVEMVIVQPRAPHPDGPIRKDEISAKDLRSWARTELYLGVKAVLADNGKTLFSGPWCRFCPVLANCKRNRQDAIDAAKAAFAAAPLSNVPPVGSPAAAGYQLPAGALSDDDLASLLDQIDHIKPWFKAVEELAHERAQKGRPLKGWKLVSKRKTRLWAGEEDEMLPILASVVSDPGVYTETRLLSPAQVESKVGKKEFAATFGPHVVKASSGTTIAPDGDPRSRIERMTAQQAFAPVQKP